MLGILVFRSNCYASCKGEGRSKGKGPVPKGKELHANKKPASAHFSSSEDELDVDQRAVLDQLLAMEQVQGLAPGHWGPQCVCVGGDSAFKAADVYF